MGIVLGEVVRVENRPGGGGEGVEVVPLGVFHWKLSGKIPHRVLLGTTNKANSGITLWMLKCCLKDQDKHIQPLYGTLSG